MKFSYWVCIVVVAVAIGFGLRWDRQHKINEKTVYYKMMFMNEGEKIFYIDKDGKFFLGEGVTQDKAVIEFAKLINSELKRIKEEDK